MAFWIRKCKKSNLKLRKPQLPTNDHHYAKPESWKKYKDLFKVSFVIWSRPATCTSPDFIALQFFKAAVNVTFSSKKNISKNKKKNHCKSLMREWEERNTWVKKRKNKYCIFATSCVPIDICDKLYCRLNANKIFYDHFKS